ncbi:MAG: 3-deoxy-7-phosphoheptulonate synthase [Planctomycetota bacterium]
MLVILRKDCTAAESDAVEEAIRKMGFAPLPVPGADRTAICITGNKGPVDASMLRRLAGVLECIPVTKPYKLVSREVHPQDTVVQVGKVAIGGANKPVVVAGPCSVETEARTLRIAEAVKAAGADMFRAGAFKPRTNPYAFQGLGAEAVETLKRVRTDVGLPVVSEVVDADSVDTLFECVDVLQVGTRNMQNYSLLRLLSQVKKPILLKRGMAASLDEWLMAAEYLLAGGNDQVILCERGVRTFSTHSRNTLDLNVVPVVRRLCHLPVLVDPSHGIGRRDMVRTMARASLATGCHGLLVETHTEPDTSYTDADQTIDVATLSGVLRDRDVLSGLETGAAP